MDGLDNLSTIEERLCYKAAIKNIPLIGAFELLPLCNMDCSMCYIRLTPEEMRKNGYIRSSKEWLSVAKEMKKEGTLYVLLTGGEPLLYNEFEEIYSGLRNMGMIVSINTNATLIDDNVADFLGKNKPRRVNVTLYGASNETYEKVCKNSNGYDQTIKGIKLLRERNIDVKINVSLVKENIDDLPKMMDLADQLEIPISVYTYMYPKARSVKRNFKSDCRISPQQVAQIDNYVEYRIKTEEEFMNNRLKTLSLYEYEKNNEPPEFLPLQCRAGKCSFWINWKGNMTPCVFLDNIHDNVFENRFRKSWDYIVKESNKILLPSDCASCDKRGVCQVCSASAYSETGSMYRKPEYLCRLTEEMLEILK